MRKPPASCRRIDHLKTVAYSCGFCDDDARKFGKLTKTSTWEALLNLHGLEFEPKAETLPTIATASNIQASPINFLEWVDFGQLIAVTLASAGLSVLILSLWPKINPLNLLPPIRINIQIGATK
ncbi:hypothetical protein AVDCRST_MAG84-5770 [uncultured Microcoleus sp.]|uniref:Uncharacterized protein n=1 Tax=uncultured Microcoleus sp. TaxID=259945 RepID=A0A6J4NPX1_9CYAN|nr:hypothetical protein AVDCRST_MAG84-5770 [uncultured Microcoleus sp.]